MSTATHVPERWSGDFTGMSTPIERPTTTAFFVQAAISFAISLVAMSFGIAKLPLGPWERGFLALGLVFVVTSSFTLAKCVRDRQEVTEVSSRVDKARLDKLLAEHDPLETKNL